MTSQRNPWLRRCLAAAVFIPLSTKGAAVDFSGKEAPSSVMQDVRRFDVPAGRLAEVLERFAMRAGIRLDMDGVALADGRTSEGLHGRYTVESALKTLLDGYGLHAVREDAGRFRLEAGGTMDEAPAAIPQAIELPRMMVWGTVHDPLDVGYTLDTSSIDRTKNGDLADAIKQVPTVRLDPTANNSMRQGDLLPTEVSISGADTYQNKIVLAGASIDNLMDPGNRSSQMDVSRVNGHSQGIFIDTAFLDGLQVLDSNISAQEGGFSGGVVKSELRGYQGKTESGFSYRTTRDAWTTMHVDPSQREQFAAGNGNPIASDSNQPYQPTFRKDFYRLHGAARWSDIGIFAGFSRRTSTIEQRQFSPPLITVQDSKIVWTYPELSPRRPIDRTSDFGVVKLSLLDRDYTLDLGLTYSHYDAQGFIPYQQDSDFTENHDGIGVTLDYAGDLGPFQAKGNMSLQDSRDARTSTSSEYRHYYGRPSLWDGDVAWGSYGPLATKQRSYQGRGSLSHVWGEGSGSRTQLDFGVEFNALDFSRERPRPLDIYYYYCVDQAEYLCPIDQHYLNTHTTYAPGRIRFSSFDYAGFAELSWRGTHWSHRFGLRYDRDDWLGNGNLAPRWLSALDLSGNGHSVLQFGANRYYGKSFLAYRIQSLDRVGAVRQSRDLPGEAFTSVALSSQWLPARGLRTPYDDELAVNWRQRMLGQYITLGYLARFGRKQVMTDYLPDTDQYRYNNAGGSRTRMVTLAAEPVRPFHGLGAEWRYNLSASWERRESNQISTTGNGVPYDATVNTGDIFLEGKVISWKEMPSKDFATPKTVSMVMLTDWRHSGLTWRNDIYWRDRYRALVADGLVEDPKSGQQLQSYHRKDYASGFNWDTGLKYTVPLKGMGRFYVSVDVLNVLDKEIVLRADADVPLYQAGRQYWLEAGFDL